MDLDEMKRAWNSESRRLEKLEITTRDLKRYICNNKVVTNRTRLLRTTMALIVLSAACIPFIIITFGKFGFPIYITVAFVVFMSLMLVAQLFSYVFIRRIDPSRVSARRAISWVYTFERYRRRVKLFSIPACVLLLMLMLQFLYNNDEMYGVIGAVVGTIIGTLVGLIKDYDIRQTIKTMKADLEDAMLDD